MFLFSALFCQTFSIDAFQVFHLIKTKGYKEHPNHQKPTIKRNLIIYFVCLKKHRKLASKEGLDAKKALVGNNPTIFSIDLTKPQLFRLIRLDSTFLNEGRNPANQLIGIAYLSIDRFFYVPGGEGFLPSTVIKPHYFPSSSCGNSYIFRRR